MPNAGPTPMIVLTGSPQNYDLAMHNPRELAEHAATSPRHNTTEFFDLQRSSTDAARHASSPTAVIQPVDMTPPEIFDPAQNTNLFMDVLRAVEEVRLGTEGRFLDEIAEVRQRERVAREEAVRLEREARDEAARIAHQAHEEASRLQRDALVQAARDAREEAMDRAVQSEIASLCAKG